MIAQHLLQYQQNQRLLLQHITSRQINPPTTIDVKAEWPTCSRNPVSQRPDNPIYQNIANSMAHQHLQAHQQLQLAIHSEMLRQSVLPVGHQSQRNIVANAIPNDPSISMLRLIVVQSSQWSDKNKQISFELYRDLGFNRLNRSSICLRRSIVAMHCLLSNKTRPSYLF